MRNLDFKYLAAKNFVCFGDDGIELNLKNYGNIVLVRGKNLDILKNGGDDSRNGVGKSSIPDILVYTLYGKPLKGLSHNQVINNQSKKKLRTEVRWGKYRVVRQRKPDSLKMWENEEGIWDLHVICPTTDEKVIVKAEEDGTATNSQCVAFDYLKKDVINPEITLGGMPATQKMIEDKIGLNYSTFCNVVVFSDSNADSFLECKTATKREVVENLLSLDKYREYSDKAKETRNIAKRKIDNIGKEYDHILVEKNACEQRVKQVVEQEKEWKNKKELELRTLIGKMKSKKEELEKSDIGKALATYNEAQDKIKELNEQIPDLESTKEKMDSMVEVAEERLENSNTKKELLALKIKNLKSDIVTHKKDLKGFEEKLEEIKQAENTTCDKCFGEVSKENADKFIAKTNSDMTELKKLISEKEKSLSGLENDLSPILTEITELNKGIKLAKEKVREASSSITSNRNNITELSKVKEPEAGTMERLLEDQIEELKKQALSKKEEYEGTSPFVEINKSTVEELENKNKEVSSKKEELAEAESELPYYEFWVKAFGDKGIRKFIIDGIIPALNSRTAYWLQFLIDGKINLTFNDQLDEKIERNPVDGDPFVYAQMSMGEKRRLNLTVSQAFAHVMMLNTGCIPSCVFLDEVTTNIDPIGVVGVYNMIAELSKDRQVFVTTHDHGLLELLNGCDSIDLERKDGFTKLL